MNRWARHFPIDDFPRLTHFGHVRDPLPWKGELHRHSGYEIKYYYGGRAGILMRRGDKVVHVTDGDIILESPGFEHEGLITEGSISSYTIGIQTGDTVVRTVSADLPPRRLVGTPSAGEKLHEEKIDEYLARLARDLNIKDYCVVHNVFAAHDIFRVIRAELEQPTLYTREIVYAKVLELLSHILRSARLKKKYAPMTFIDRVVCYIETHFDGPIRLSLLAAEVRKAPSYLCREFKRHMGMTIMTYLAAYRIGRAKEMLCRGKSVSEVAQRSGFRNIYYFSSSFKKHVGVSPLQYRRSAGCCSILHSTATSKRAKSILPDMQALKRTDIP